MAQKLLEELSEDLAVDVYNIAKQLQINKEFIISNQVIRSATSVGANISEAQFAQSRADFITKLRIALKEANETRYWLRVLFRTKNIPNEAFEDLSKRCTNIIVKLVFSIKTTTKK